MHLKEDTISDGDPFDGNKIRAKENDRYKTGEIANQSIRHTSRIYLFKIKN